MMDELPLSVIVCSYNRKDLLRKTLRSLNAQSLDKAEFEIVVIDDGSSDGTLQVVNEFADRLPIRYFFQNNAGLGAAKNHGIYASRGKIVFFCDDDDIAGPDLLRQHLKTHYEYPDHRFAVLNRTDWSAEISVTPLMHFITQVGCFLFSYPHIEHGSILDFTYFWGGRSSCKRSFLIEHGVFDPVFRFGCEDIELGYRLSKAGLQVVYNADAISYMIRSIGLDDFCGRLIKQGRSQYRFSKMYDDPKVTEWCEVTDAERTWKRIGPVYEDVLRSAHELEKIGRMRSVYGIENDGDAERLLFQSYWWVFRSSKLKGIMEARMEDLHPQN